MNPSDTPSGSRGTVITYDKANKTESVKTKGPAAGK